MDLVKPNSLERECETSMIQVIDVRRYFHDNARRAAPHPQ